MNTLHTVFHPGFDDSIDIEVCANRALISANFEGLITFVPMLGESILV